MLVMSDRGRKAWSARMKRAGKIMRQHSWLTPNQAASNPFFIDLSRPFAASVFHKKAHGAGEAQHDSGRPPTQAAIEFTKNRFSNNGLRTFLREAFFLNLRNLPPPQTVFPLACLSFFCGVSSTLRFLHAQKSIEVP